MNQKTPGDEAVETIQTRYDQWFERNKTQITFFFPDKTEMDLKLIFQNVFTEGALAGSTIILEKLKKK